MVAGEDTVIEKGLAPGETVVVDGQLRLTPGATIATKEKQPAGGKKK
jgi:multidrug efflux system membrane fusion protein